MLRNDCLHANLVCVVCLYTVQGKYATEAPSKVMMLQVKPLMLCLGGTPSLPLPQQTAAAQ